MRFSHPTPYKDYPHTADVGIQVQGFSIEEAYARAALAMADLQAGGNSIEPLYWREFSAKGKDQVDTLVDLCRKILSCFFLESLLLGAIEIVDASPNQVIARGLMGLFDLEKHAEGIDIKAVTYARAKLEVVTGGRWEAVLIFDI